MTGGRRFLAAAAAALLGLVLAVALGEAVSRVLLPISPGARRVAPDGREVPAFLVPGAHYRQVSSEYDAVTTITATGHRAPEARDPVDVVFLGDSFTFGQGLSDEESFPAIYARSLGLEVVNLGVPGAGTAGEVDELEAWLAAGHPPPREIKIFVFAMIDEFSAGNDLADNLADAERAGAVPAEEANDDAAGSRWIRALLSCQRTLQTHSNLVRVLKFRAGPQIKALVRPGLDAGRRRGALQATARELARLDVDARRQGIPYEIYLLHPVQDLLRGGARRTYEALAGVAPAPIVATSEAFAPDPAQCYYAYDGHLNPTGSRRLAEFLVARDSAKFRNPPGAEAPDDP